MSYSNELTAGAAELIAAGGLALWRPTGIYTSGETGITVGVMPDAPDGIVCLTAYPVEDTDLTDAITAVQVRMRAGRDPRVVQQLADGVFDLLHNREHFALGTVRVALAWRQSQAWIGQDTHGRMELTANYYLRTTRPGPHLYE